jgi:nucleotide-binding universal stress UspA family protein
MAIRNVLVPTDFSAHSAQALEHAIELAKPLSATIHLLHSYWVAISVGSPDLFVLPADFSERLRSAAQAELEQLEKRVVQAGVACKSHVMLIPPFSAILDLAESLPADLIVMGTQGRTGLKHVLLGSVAERTVRLAPCPVLTVKAKTAA